ncbi:MAG: lipase family protein [Bacteroidota bacterium]|nr:lipase family protein [Bacteroidota bacterium]
MRHHRLLTFLLFSFLFSCNQQDNKKTAPGETILAKPAFTDTTACMFSEIAYCRDPQAQLTKYLPGWKVIWNPLPVGGNYAFVATDSTTYVLAVRGSLISFTEDAFYNWIYHDLNVMTQDAWPYSNVEKARISQGSYIGWQNLEKMRDRVSGKSLWAFLSEKVVGPNPLILTGHSLGGNLATVYASYLWSKFDKSGHPKNNINVITFAAPAPGNKSFADDFNTKFPSSLRIENRNDIVPKFPCSDKISKLADLYSPAPSSSDISVGYNNITTKLSNVFTLISSSLAILEVQSNFSGYTHTNGDGKLITIALSGKDTANTPAAWFAEAGYQHSMAQYATFFNAPVIVCE